MSFEAKFSLPPVSLTYTTTAGPGAPDPVVRRAAYVRFTDAASRLFLRLYRAAELRQRSTVRVALTMNARELRMALTVDDDAIEAMAALAHVRQVGGIGPIRAADATFAMLMALSDAADTAKKGDKKVQATMKLYGERFKDFIAASRRDLDPRPKWWLHPFKRHAWKKRMEAVPTSEPGWPSPELEARIQGAMREIEA